MNNDIYSALLIMIMSGVTILLRFLPFVIYKDEKKVSVRILYLGEVLPSAAIGMLVIYCLRDINFRQSPFGAYELLASLVVILSQKLFKNSICLRRIDAE